MVAKKRVVRASAPSKAKKVKPIIIQEGVFRDNASTDAYAPRVGSVFPQGALKRFKKKP